MQDFILYYFFGAFATVILFLAFSLIKYFDEKAMFYHRCDVKTIEEVNVKNIKERRFKL